MAIVNSVALGFFGFLSLPTLSDVFGSGEPATISIRIGAGAVNSSVTGIGLGGDCPTVVLYDAQGVPIGKAAGSSSNQNNGQDTTVGIQEGGFQTLTMKSSKTPEYIQLSAFGNDAVCVSWFETTSAAEDFHTWNGAMAQTCGLPWYPSTALFPTDAAQYRPPCFWMSADGRFVKSLTARLLDFAFPDSETANATSTQWLEHRDTLCEAPARQQFWNGDVNCIPHYPSGNLPQRNPDGTDADFDFVKNGYVIDCFKPGEPFNDINLNAFLPGGKSIITDIDAPITLPPSQTSVVIPPDATLQTSLNLGALGRRNIETESSNAADPAVTSPPTQELYSRKAFMPDSERNAPSHAPIISRRAEHRAANPHQWCEEGKLVISQHLEHSAVEVCQSETSWGPDFVSIQEGIYCDMCERKVWLLCDDKDAGMDTRDGTSTDTSPMAETCFDLEKQLLRMPVRVRRDGKSPRFMYGKRFEHVSEWK